VRRRPGAGWGLATLACRATCGDRLHSLKQEERQQLQIHYSRKLLKTINVRNSLKIMVGARGFEPPTPCAQGGWEEAAKAALFPTACDLRHWRQAIETCGALLKLEALDSYKIIYILLGGPSAETKAVATLPLRRRRTKYEKEPAQRGEDHRGQLSKWKAGRKTRRRGREMGRERGHALCVEEQVGACKSTRSSVCGSWRTKSVTELKHLVADLTWTREVLKAVISKNGWSFFRSM